MQSHVLYPINHVYKYHMIKTKQFKTKKHAFSGAIKPLFISWNGLTYAFYF